MFNSLEGEFSLEKLKGKKVILYFYPKDNTKGCSLEAMDFSSLKDEFDKLGAVIVGVSKDSIESHKKFKDSKELSINLVSDEEKVLHEQFGVWKLKKNYGREYMGTERSTFILDESGNIIEEFRNVKATGHAKRVLERLREIK